MRAPEKSPAIVAAQSAHGRRDAALRPELAAFFVLAAPKCSEKKDCCASGVLTEIAQGRGYN